MKVFLQNLFCLVVYLLLMFGAVILFVKCLVAFG